jgi:hypothetical protein
VNPNYAFQLHQAERIKSRAEVLADDVRRGRSAAAAARDRRRIRAWGSRLAKVAGPL